MSSKLLNLVDSSVSHITPLNTLVDNTLNWLTQKMTASAIGCSGFVSSGYCQDAPTDCYQNLSCPFDVECYAMKHVITYFQTGKRYSPTSSGYVYYCSGSEPYPACANTCT
jgi:hypothetical protein